MQLCNKLKLNCSSPLRDQHRNPIDDGVSASAGCAEDFLILQKQLAVADGTGERGEGFLDLGWVDLLDGHERNRLLGGGFGRPGAVLGSVVVGEFFFDGFYGAGFNGFSSDTDAVVDGVVI